MKSKQGKYSGQSKRRFNRFYNSDNRRNETNSNQAFNNLSNFNQNVFDILNPQALPDMYQRNNFRSFNNTQSYGNAPYQQQGSQSIHMDMCNVQDHFRSHANQGFNKVIPQMNFHSPPSDFGMSQYGPMHNNNTHQGHASQSHSNSQRMNYSTSNNTGKSNQVEIFGKSPVKNQRCQESSDNSQTNKMCEVFNDVLGEKPPESSSSKSGQSNPVPYGNNLSPFNSQIGNKTRVHRSRYRIIYNKITNPDPNWEPTNEGYQRSRERCARQDVDDRYDEEIRNLSSDSTKSRQKKLEDSRKSVDSSVSTEKISSKESKEPSNQVLSDKNKPETKKSNITYSITYSTRSSKISCSHTPTNKPSDTKNSTTNKPSDTKNSTTNKPSDTKNSTANKPSDTKNSSNSKNNDNSTKNITHTDKDKNKEKESTKEKPTSGEKTEKKASSVSKKRQRFPSSSSSGSDTDCVIEETKTPEKVSGVQKESLEKVKTKTKAIMRATSSATARPSQSSNLGKVTKDSPIEKKKKKKDSTPLEDTSPVSTTIINVNSPVSTTTTIINLTSPSSTATVSSAASTVTNTTTAPSLIAKKTLSIGDAQKLMKPRTRKDAHRADQLVKEFWEKRARAQAASGSNPSSANQPSDPSFDIDHLDLATLDLKDLKTDIPKEISDVLSKVYDFSSTEKNPIVLDDDVDSSKKTSSDDTSKRKRKNSEPAPRKRTKEGEKMSSRPAEAKKSKHNNTEQSDAEDVVATSNAPSLSSAASNLSPGHPSSSSPQPGILKILLQLQLKEDEMHEHISNMDDEIQNIQAMIVDLSHKLTSKKHHRDMMINEEKRLKAFRIQALRGWWSVKTPTDLQLGSVDSNNKASPDLHQQFLDCMSTTQPEAHPPEGDDFTTDGQVMLPGKDKVINIVPQTDDDQGNILQGSHNFVPSYQSARPIMSPSGPIMSPSRPILSPPPRSMDGQSGSVRYLGILNDLSHLFKRPANDSNPTSRQEVQSNDNNNTSTKSAESSELDISKVKSEFAGKN